MSPLAHPKGKTPSRSYNLRKGVFLRLAACQSLSLWERWHCEAMTERASPAGKSRRRSDGQALCQSDTIAASGIRRQHPCPLSRAYARQLPQRGSHWHVGQAPSSYNLSVSLRSTAPLVGEPLAKRRSFPLCQGLPSVGEVALRSNDGEVEPGRWHGVSADGEVELLSHRESLCLRGLREFVENARVKREEFVNVIKMRRRY